MKTKTINFYQTVKIKLILSLIAQYTITIILIIFIILLAWGGYQITVNVIPNLNNQLNQWTRIFENISNRLREMSLNLEKITNKT